MKYRMIALVLALALLLALPAAAVTEMPDLSRTGSIRLTISFQDHPIGGGDLTLYQIATVREENGFFFTPVAGLEEFTFTEQELADTGLPARALTRVHELGLSGQTKQIGEDGVVQFEDLPLGLYLLEQKTGAPGFTRISPFLVSIPMQDGDGLIYDIDASPKPEPIDPSSDSLETTNYSSETTEPSGPENPSGPNLPQTGQLNWPIPVLVVLGSFCLLLGLWLLRAGKKDRR